MFSVRIKSVLARATVAAMLTATAGVGAAITATPASALPSCSQDYIRRQQHIKLTWEEQGNQWGWWADEDRARQDWAAYGNDLAHRDFAYGMADAADQRLG